MIYGIGTDMIEVQRLAEKMGKENGFRAYVFSEGEIAYCESKTNKYEHYAARFAAKEAFLKALGTGWVSGTSFHEIEITHDASGKPHIGFAGETALTVREKGISRVLVSLSHLNTLASAVVIIET
jgi:holo-[acyl-carrier protein] synthase